MTQDLFACCRLGRRELGYADTVGGDLELLPGIVDEVADAFAFLDDGDGCEGAVDSRSPGQGFFGEGLCDLAFFGQREPTEDQLAMVFLE